MLVNLVRSAGLAACLLASIASGGVRADVIIDFEDLGVAPGTQLNPAAGVGVVTNGFNFTPGPNNASGFDDLHISNAEAFLPYNGTTIAGSHDDVVLTKVGGGVFSLDSFDFAGLPTDFEVDFSVVGIRSDSSMITQRFTPDGLVDGTDGVVDFQTFFVTGDWTNLVSVTWNHSGAGTNGGSFGLDNIRLDPNGTVPEPTSIVMAGLAGLIGLGFARARRAGA